MDLKESIIKELEKCCEFSAFTGLKRNGSELIDVELSRDEIDYLLEVLKSKS